jgi:predicted nucleic acid-binding protein
VKTAVDSSVLIDVLQADPDFGEGSSHALRRAYDDGALVACDVVWAEVRARFSSDGEFAEAIELLGIVFEGIGPDAAAEAGSMWRAYRRAGAPRGRMIADFLVGAHARCQADRLLTRDRGFYRAAFRGLRLIDPAE